MASSPAQREETRGDARFAALLTWIAPGAGHLLLGVPLFALLAFLVVEGSFLVGLRLSDGMLLEYLEPDLQGPFAGALSPEVGNLGMLVYLTKVYGFGPGQPRPWPPHISLGVWLTAVSGVLNALLIAHAVWLARQPKREPVLRRNPTWWVLCAWLVPGLGHWLQGRRLRAAVLFVALIGLFVLGTLLAQGSNLDRERHFYYWAGQFLLGGPAWIAELVHGHARVDGELPYVDAGLGMSCVAGLLNVLAMIDVYGHGEERPEAAPVADRPAPAAPIETRPGTLA